MLYILSWLLHFFITKSVVTVSARIFTIIFMLDISTIFLGCPKRSTSLWITEKIIFIYGHTDTLKEFYKIIIYVGEIWYLTFNAYYNINEKHTYRWFLALRHQLLSKFRHNSLQVFDSYHLRYKNIFKPMFHLYLV